MMCLRSRIVLLALSAAPVFGASVQFSNLLPDYTFPEVIKTDAAGNLYVGGNYGLPPGTPQVFLAKITADGSKLIYFSSVVCASPPFGICYLNSMATGPDGSGYLDYYWSTGAAPDATPFSGYEIAVFNPTGQIEASINGYPASDMALDSQGNLYLTGNDPTVASSGASLSGTNQSNNFIVKLNAQGQVIYAIHNYGGSHITVDANGNVFTVAADSYVDRRRPLGKLSPKIRPIARSSGLSSPSKIAR